jgi:hypothetical protein
VKLRKEHWQYFGSVTFIALAVLAWSTLLFVPTERSSRTLTSQTTAYEFYMQGNHRAAWDTLMALELELRPLNLTVADSLEGLIFDLYIKASLALSSADVAEAFGKLLARKDAPASRRPVWEAYEKALLDIETQKYSVKAFLDKVDSMQAERAQKAATESQPTNMIPLNESFRVYYAYAQKKWEEARLAGIKANLRWLYAAGYAGSHYYAQGRTQLEEFLIACSSNRANCLPEDERKAGEILRLLRGVDLPIGEEEP